LAGAGAGALVPAAPRDLATKVEAIAHRYPDRRSLTLPALRFAQEEHGWLPPEALREVAEVLDLTPAYCQAVASFYDMFHLEPVGRHMLEICTNLSCALVGAQRVVEAFEEALGVGLGETTADDGVTLRAVECLGGCGYAPIVAIDNRHRRSVKPEDAAGIVEELRGSA
jgi:NADH-quinone oxidoreductase subunit E